MVGAGGRAGRGRAGRGSAGQGRAGQGHPQHPDQKQRMRVKKPPRWGVCGAGFADAGADCIVVSWVVVGIAGVAVAAVAAAVAAAASSFSAAISNSICSDIRSLSTASVWSLLNSITASMRFLITPVVRSV